ncbi:hypothetical protein HCA58_22415 [Micromonospora sp. HNM0581]|uniref:hypothetical protein n=1 Tax=Micromonospora sp. HNM0581 TaxID=2716341 RepID=UPI00146D2B6F|nr:hypothetical protein [Micromonospora sp. HNM0581]NLU81047.1 hypothetical protein [Micromonospora sp. HNM0581]
MTARADELFAARLTFPVGDRVRGTVSAIPMGAGRAGLLVDLGQLPQGWVDVLHLPDDPTDWPAVGKTGLFEVLQHRPGQVRLFPLDAGMRGPRTRFSRWSGREWAAITRRYPEGAVVVGTVTDVFPGNHEYTVAFDDCWSVIEYEDNAPSVGWTGSFRVTRLLEWTHRILLTPEM